MFPFPFVFISCRFYFFSFSFFLVFISSCHRFLRCFHCYLHFFTLLFLHCCCYYCERYALERTFLTLQCFLLYTPSRHMAQPAFMKASLGLKVQPWMLQGFPLRYETQTWSISYFELHSVQHLNYKYGTLFKLVKICDKELLVVKNLINFKHIFTW